MKSIMSDKAWLTINCVGMTHEDRLRIPRLYRNLGMEHVAVRYHEGVWRDGGESFTFRTNASPTQGGDDALRDMVTQVKSLGWLCGLYTNYTDFSPVNPSWDENWLRLDENGNWAPSWFAAYSVKPMIAWQEQMNYAPEIHQKYGTNHCYCDVHTAVPPFHRVDYDARVPGAATFLQTFNTYGQILLRERQAHKGPVYSEGGNHWWYAGLVDGNYANAFPSLGEQPLFVDFDLLKIHPLEMDAGNVSYVFETDMNKAKNHTPLTLAYGHICQLTPYNEFESMKRYYLVQPLQSYYAMETISKIEYWNGNEFLDTSKALVSGANLKRQIKVQYVTGLNVWVNTGQEDWPINIEGHRYILPTNGFYAVAADGRVVSYSVLKITDDQEEPAQVDFARGPDSIYFDTRGAFVDLGDIAGQGSVALKKEKSGWELIPARKFEKVGFSPVLIGLNNVEVDVEGLSEFGVPVLLPEAEMKDGMLWIQSAGDQVFKYRITPAQSSSL
jgi:hypothetical protein